jgi:hypothetical protein
MDASSGCEDMTERRKQYYLRNKEKYRERGKEWFKNNPEFYRDRHRNNPKERMLKSAKHRAKVKGWEFSLTEEDIHIPLRCPYLDVELTREGGRLDTNVSLDRIDSTKGYVKGNVQVISDLANKMKSSATQDQLIIFAENVLRMHKIDVKPEELN